MVNVRKGVLALLAVVVLGIPTIARAASSDPQLCSVHVEYYQNQALRLTYDKTFVVSEDAPFTDDFSTATRFRFFDARVTINARGIPVVFISWDADVNVFNAMAFQADLTVTDQTHGESTHGRAGFFGSAVGSNSANYFLNCQKAN